MNEEMEGGRDCCNFRPISCRLVHGKIGAMNELMSKSVLWNIYSAMKQDCYPVF